MFSKKGISPVVATALLLVVAVVAVVGFQGWFSEFSSSTFTDVELQTSQNSDLKVEGVIDDILYLKSSSNDVDLKSLSIVGSNGDVLCTLSKQISLDLIGLVGHWTFDEIINDSGTMKVLDYSGLGNDGIVKDHNISNDDANTLPQLVKGNLGNALDFDGIDDYIQVPHSNSLDLTSDFTVVVIHKCYWFGGCQIVTKDTVSTSNRSWSMYSGGSNHPSDPNSGAIALHTSSGFAGHIFSNSDSLSQNNFNFQAFTFNTSYYGSIYLNGNLGVSIDKIEPLNSVLAPLIFGARISPVQGQNVFRPQTIDEIRIYNRTLSNSELDTLYWYSIKSQTDGINKIDLSSCNLTKGTPYTVLTSSDSKFVEKSIIVK
jgi:flagellin-like protein